MVLSEGEGPKDILCRMDWALEVGCGLAEDCSYPAERSDLGFMWKGRDESGDTSAISRQHWPQPMDTHIE